MRFAITILLGAALLANPLASPAAAQTGGSAIPTTTLSLGTATLSTLGFEHGNQVIDSWNA